MVLTQDFFIRRREVTRAEYQAVMTDNPSWPQAPNLPVAGVSYYRATHYCALLTALDPSPGRLADGWEYHLPTEAQWEYACRSGTTTATAFGSQMSSTPANFDGQYPYNGGAVGPALGRSPPGESYAPNAWGLYALHGNVSERCADRHGPYPTMRVQDPQGPPTGSHRLARGGNDAVQGGHLPFRAPRPRPRGDWDPLSWVPRRPGRVR